MFTSWSGKVLGCASELPAREDSYLFWHRFSGMRPCLAGNFLQIQQPWPHQSAQLRLHHTSLVTRLSCFLSSIHRSNTVCSQQSVNFLDQQRDIHFAQHSFTISIVFDFPLPLLTSPENNFFLVLITWTTVKVAVFLHSAGYFLQKRQNRG